MITSLFNLVAAILLAAAPAGTTKQAGWNVYNNPRYGTHIAYPGRIFTRRTDPENGDGVTLRSADGAVLTVYGTHNINNFTPRQWLDDAAAAEEGTVTYRTSGANFAVMSGTRGNRIFYARDVFDSRAGVIHGYVLEYPRRLQSRYGPIIARLSSSLSFRPVRYSR